MPWNFSKHEVTSDDIKVIMWMRQMGIRNPWEKMEGMRKGGVPEELGRWDTASWEATKAAGGVSVDLHEGSRQLACSPERII
jgi:hypothetical protein